MENIILHEFCRIQVYQNVLSYDLSTTIEVLLTPVQSMLSSIRKKLAVQLHYITSVFEIYLKKVLQFN